MALTSRELAAGTVRWSGAAYLARRTLARRRVSVLLYHDPGPDLFERHLEYLSRRYRFVTLAQLVEALGDRRRFAELPSNSLVITFDDGLRGNYALLPLFRRYGVVPTIYLCTRIVNTSRHYWFLESGVDVERLKMVSNDDRVAHLREHTGFTETTEYPEEARQSLTLAEIDEMKDTVDFQSHSLTHPVLTLTSEEECREQIFASKEEVESLVGRACEHFSFPNYDYSERELRLVREAGYQSARTGEIGWVGPDCDPFRLRLLVMGGDTSSVNVLASHLAGTRALSRLVARRRTAGSASARA